VFEPRYRVMVRECLRNDHEFGVVLIERGSEVGGGDVRFDVGTLARIVRATELDDGRYALTAVGLRRMRVESWLPDDPYPQAEVAELADAELPDDATAAATATATRDRVEAALRELFSLWSQFEPRVADVRVELAADPAHAAYEAAAAAPFGPLDAQRVLEVDGTAERLALIDSLLRDEIEVLRARPHG
jgi:Lon protease-like protein